MKKLFALASLLTSLSSFAGGMLDIPVELIAIDNQGRAKFIQNVLAETGLTAASDVKFRDLQSIVIGGDEEGSDYKGGYFVYNVVISQGFNLRYKCHQYLTVGVFHLDLTRPVECVTVK